MIDYFFLFSNQAAALADPIVGAFSDGSGNWRLDICFPGIAVSTASALVNGISTLTGFWICISQTADNPTFDSHANLVISLNREAATLHATVLNAGGHTSFQATPVPAGSTYHRPLNQ